MLKFIVNQDHDAELIEVTESSSLFAKANFYKGEIADFNLMYGNPEVPDDESNCILGTFASLKEVQDEMIAIEMCEDGCYIVSGYHPECKHDHGDIFSAIFAEVCDGTL